MPSRQSTDPSQAQDGVRSVVRAMDIMFLMRADRPWITLREVQDNTGLPRTTLIRLLTTLEQIGLLWSTGDHHYSPGPGLLHWARLAQEAWRLPTSAQHALNRLVAATGETASIYVRQHVHRVCVATEEGPQALRHVTYIGRELPLGVAAPSYVLIRDLTGDELRAVVEDSAESSCTVPKLREWQRTVSANGYAATHGEREDGLSVVAVPLSDNQGQVVAALTVAGPTERFTQDRERGFVDALRAAAESVESSGFVTSIGNRRAVDRSDQAAPAHRSRTESP